MKNKRELVYQIIIGFLILTNIGLVAFPAPAPEPIVYYAAGAVGVQSAGNSALPPPPGRVGASMQQVQQVATPQPAAAAAASSRNTPTPANIQPGQGFININTASSAELQRLPGVGPAIAQRIVEHRQTRGAFTRIEDIMLVNGIGAVRFENIREVITI